MTRNRRCVEGNKRRVTHRLLPAHRWTKIVPECSHMLRKLELADMDVAAQVHRTAFDAALPWLTGRHTPQQDRWFFRERLFKACQLWGAFDGAQMTGIIAFREFWIDQLYVLPSSQQRGIGTKLLQIAQCALPRLYLWTFQGNLRARRFYERRGFLLLEETHGANNEEKEPDALYLWARNQAQSMDTASSGGGIRDALPESP